jgi:(p)ppGpp synthase/HD superfamily hydrolase
VPHGANPSFLNELPRASKAVEFAEQRHAGQRRAGDHAPFLIHPLEVASMLYRAGYPEPVVAAAVLHDVLEDTDAERWELEALFGEEVSGLVAAVSDDSAIADEDERKEELRARVRRAGGYAAAVYAADKISKARELRALLASGVSDGEAAAKFERYRRALETIEDVIPGSRMAELLRFELETLESLPPQGTSGALGREPCRSR